MEEQELWTRTLLWTRHFLDCDMKELSLMYSMLL